MAGNDVPTSSQTRRDWLRRVLGVAAPGLAACTTGGSGSLMSPSARKTRAQWEYHNKFLASGARLRFRPHSAHGCPWTMKFEQFYRAHRGDPRVGYAVKNLATGRYLAEFQADRLFMGGSMPKPAIAAILLERARGNLSGEEFQHIVYVCDKSINASWFYLLGRIGPYDEAVFKSKYRLPASDVRGNWLSPRFYAEFYERCVNYRLDHGNELLLEAMRRDQYGLGRWVMPASITYIGGKTGNYGEWDHESLFFYHRGTPYAIVLFTRGHFAPSGQDWRLGAMMGGLFRDYCA
ncbi:MAG: hypothetical protein HS117_06570 [Verrucomicrobiaceae bacterium]|nr:hypothetical protein [Verrucomicrobiaceae bacterium]